MMLRQGISTTTRQTGGHLIYRKCALQLFRTGLEGESRLSFSWCVEYSPVRDRSKTIFGTSQQISRKRCVHSGKEKHTPSKGCGCASMNKVGS